MEGIWTPLNSQVNLKSSIHYILLIGVGGGWGLGICQKASLRVSLNSTPVTAYRMTNYPPCAFRRRWPPHHSHLQMDSIKLLANEWGLMTPLGNIWGLNKLSQSNAFLRNTNKSCQRQDSVAQINWLCCCEIFSMWNKWHNMHTTGCFNEKLYALHKFQTVLCFCVPNVGSPIKKWVKRRQRIPDNLSHRKWNIKTRTLHCGI